MEDYADVKNEYNSPIFSQLNFQASGKLQKLEF